MNAWRALILAAVLAVVAVGCITVDNHMSLIQISPPEPGQAVQWLDALLRGMPVF